MHHKHKRQVCCLPFIAVFVCLTAGTHGGVLLAWCIMGRGGGGGRSQRAPQIHVPVCIMWQCSAIHAFATPSHRAQCPCSLLAYFVIQGLNGIKRHPCMVSRISLNSLKLIPIDELSGTLQNPRGGDWGMGGVGIRGKLEHMVLDSGVRGPKIGQQCLHFHAGVETLLQSLGWYSNMGTMACKP